MPDHLKIKICGMRDLLNMESVAAAIMPDYMGFIFYDKSPRFVGQSFRMPELVPPILKVGVFVNEQPERILDLTKRYGLDYVQLHGDESPDYCKQLKRGVRVIKAFSVNAEFDFEEVTAYKSHVDYFLFDTKGKQRGGNGIPFDWNLLSSYDQEIPFFLSGGLSAENSNQLKLVKGMNVHALDLNSGVEDSPGIKNIAKISELLNSVK